MTNSKCAGAKSPYSPHWRTVSHVAFKNIKSGLRYLDQLHNVFFLATKKGDKYAHLSTLFLMFLSVCARLLLPKALLSSVDIA